MLPFEVLVDNSGQEIGTSMLRALNKVGQGSGRCSEQARGKDIWPCYACVA